MKGREWGTAVMPDGATVRHRLRLGRDFRLDVYFAYGPMDTNHAAPLSAKAELVFTGMVIHGEQTVCAEDVTNWRSDTPVEKRIEASRTAAITMARRFRNCIQRPIRRLELPLRDARP